MINKNKQVNLSTASYANTTNSVSNLPSFKKCFKWSLNATVARQSTKNMHMLDAGLWGCKLKSQSYPEVGGWWWN